MTIITKIQSVFAALTCMDILSREQLFYFYICVPFQCGSVHKKDPDPLGTDSTFKEITSFWKFFLVQRQHKEIINVLH